MAKSDPRFPLSVFVQAMTSAGVDSDVQERVVKRLLGQLPKRGRKGERDGPDLLRLGELLDKNPEMTVNRAATQIAAEAPEPNRDALRKRLVRKWKATG